MRLTRDGRTEPAAVIDTRAQWLNGFAAGRDGLYFTEDAAVKKLCSDGSVSVVADKVMPADCPRSGCRRCRRPTCEAWRWRTPATSMSRRPAAASWCASTGGATVTDGAARRKSLGSHGRSTARRCGLRPRVPAHAWRRSAAVAAARAKGGRRRTRHHCRDGESSDTMSGLLANGAARILGGRAPAGSI